ncbi:hypothetical protein [Kutzneria sp. NPDC052558]|uniref:hypothetical protein n=1 Tax=Kutzneria sp. NPDC052558 TaxID=3364121 RepID=UPI0037C5CABD
MPTESLVKQTRPPRGPRSPLARRSFRRAGGPDIARSIGAGTTVWPCGEDWLTAAVAKTVTTYTSPCDRVLLHDAGQPSTTVSTYPHVSLSDTAWTVIRLGRAVIISSNTESARLAAAPDGERACLALAVVQPDRHGIPDPRALTTQLAGNGILAVITHAEEIDGHLRDRTVDIIRAARSAGFRYHDHIILLRDSGTRYFDLLVFTAGPADA